MLKTSQPERQPLAWQGPDINVAARVQPTWYFCHWNRRHKHDYDTEGRTSRRGKATAKR